MIPNLFTIVALVAAGGLVALVASLAREWGRQHRVEFRFRAREAGATVGKLAYRVVFLPFIPEGGDTIHGLSDHEETERHLARSHMDTAFDIKSDTHIASFGYVNLSCDCPGCRKAAVAFRNLGPGWQYRDDPVPQYILDAEKAAAAEAGGAGLPGGLEPFHLN